eukprot:scaffold4799_cov115-Isochrysis_galbana.AAC.1
MCDEDDGQQSASSVIADQLTIIVTTSPIGRHPCSAMLDWVIGSIHRHCHGTIRCRMFVVADGFRVVEAGQPSRRKRGLVSESQARAYEVHKRAIRHLCASGTSPYHHAEFLDQPCHRGFSLGVCRALRLVRTPFVMVVQHDRPMVRDAPLLEILAAMTAHPSLEHVGFPTGSTVRYELTAMSKYAIAVADSHVRHERLRFLPLLQFLDSTHVARTTAYRALMRRHGFKRGDFTEDTVGQVQIAAIRSRGMAAHEAFGTWLLDDGVDRAMVSHLDGKDPRAMEKVSAWREEDAQRRAGRQAGAQAGRTQGEGYFEDYSEELLGGAAGGEPVCGFGRPGAACWSCRAGEALQHEALSRAALAVLQMRTVKEYPDDTSRAIIRVRVCLRTWSLAQGTSEVSECDDLSIIWRMKRSGVRCDVAPKRVPEEPTERNERAGTPELDG